jgi:hypothetical protein
MFDLRWMAWLVRDFQAGPSICPPRQRARGLLALTMASATYSCPEMALFEVRGSYAASDTWNYSQRCIHQCYNWLSRCRIIPFAIRS